MNNNLLFYFVIAVLILIIYSIYKNKISVTRVVITKKIDKPIIEKPKIEDCSIDKNKMNNSKCFQTKVDECKVGSYKQCTNNKKHTIKTCDCYERSSLLCNENENLSIKCLIENNHYKTKKKYNNNPNNTRVGMFNVDRKTPFDNLK